MKKIVIFFCTIFLLIGTVQGQKRFEKMYLKKREFADKVANLRQKFSKNKVIPERIELASLVALSYFPELQDEHIEFRFKRISSTMKAQPHPSFIFDKNNNRRYVVYLSTKNAAYETLTIGELSFNALVGWIGHELSHISDFTTKSKWAIMTTGLKYTSQKKKREYERSIDIMTIEHGLGYALYEGMEYVYGHKKLSKSYKKNLQENYLSLDEILTYIQHYEKKKGGIDG